MDWDVRGKTLEEKVGQLLVVSFENEASLTELVAECKVGGVVYYTCYNAPLDFVSTRSLSDRLLTISSNRPPLLISIDHEGGRVQHCFDGFTSIPKMSDLSGKSEEELFALGQTMGAELCSVGIQVNYAPVVDVIEAESQVLSGRMVSSDPIEVTRVASALIDGMHASGLLCTLKHFPGHGSTTVDSHYALPVIIKSFHEMESSDLVPFEKLAHKVDLVMMGHLWVPDYDAENMVTFSSKWYSYLREKIGFEGVIVTDSLTMAPAGAWKEGALKALKAGADLLLFGTNIDGDGQRRAMSSLEVREIHAYLLEAVLKDESLRKRVEESYSRVFRLKKKMFFAPQAKSTKSELLIKK